jgi:hypothetical protein
LVAGLGAEWFPTGFPQGWTLRKAVVSRQQLEFWRRAVHLRVTATEVFPTGVIRVIDEPVAAPDQVGYDDILDQVPEGN